MTDFKGKKARDAILEAMGSDNYNDFEAVIRDWNVQNKNVYPEQQFPF